MNIIMHDLMHNRLIFRHIFKKTELWKPLLSAQLAVMNHSGIKELNDPLWKGLLTSMKHWETKHFIHALNEGLMRMANKQRTAGSKSTSLELIVGSQLLCSIMYFSRNFECNAFSDSVDAEHKSLFQYLERRKQHFPDSTPSVYSMHGGQMLKPMPSTTSMEKEKKRYGTIFQVQRLQTH